jgi:hypothetical protein
MLRRTRNPDSCGKSATGTEKKTGIRRIPAGKGNLVPNKCSPRPREGYVSSKTPIKARVLQTPRQGRLES